jgi:hypothetical protein
MTPRELLRNQLSEYEKALHKSFESCKSGHITKVLHETHKGNLEPKIFQYKQAIQVLDTWLD